MINIRARGEREDSSDLTSLIDVVFILLIFFILAASFAVHSINFDLPPAKTSNQNNGTRSLARCRF
jgi:biopolymer transport protein ExbD